MCHASRLYGSVLSYQLTIDNKLIKNFHQSVMKVTTQLLH